MKLTVKCPAKINTFLAVGPVDSRRYHPLRTIFQAVDLCDTVTVEYTTEPTQITCNWDGLPAENTVSKALRYLREAAVLPEFRIHIEKVIPAESGLGGGSSDAAGLIRAIMRWIPEALPGHTAQEIAFAVGADVPFFLVGGRARGEGYGEILTPLPDEPERHLVIARPNAGVSTASAYSQLDEKPREFFDFPGDDRLYNDFERTAPCECLDLIERLISLGATQSGLSGSGSAVFGFFNTSAEAETAAGQIKSEGIPFAVPTRTLTRKESLWIS